ncbi:hypothetical protein LIER_23479 [Lithospermum erythrorhizon]|uniref:Uncharacterized protein n=1 Tax=Lithospermum erythrorhizon TaxID=34254 RepID=A0AAV3R0W8_LITER
MGFIQAGGRLMWYTKSARKCQRETSGSGDPEALVSEDDNAEVRPRRSISAQLNSLEEGHARLQQDFAGLRDLMHRHHRKQQCGILALSNF